MRVKEKLSAAKIAGKNMKPGRHGDGDGLYLQVTKEGTKSWLLRYQLAHRNREMGLGAFPKIGLSSARDLAKEAHQLIIRGLDPIDAREERKQALKAESAKRITFKEAAEKYIEAHKSGWRNDKHIAQWTATLTTYAYPVIGKLAVGDVELAHISKILDPIWATKTDTASRLRGRIEKVLDWAATRGFRRGENPARWRGNLATQLPKKSKVRTVRHQPALPFAEMPGFMADLRKRDSISARALELTILAAARTSEVLNAQWGEFDLKEGIWIVPADRMKAAREHRVPLSDRALEIVKGLKREKGSPYLFPGAKDKRPLSNMAMLQLLRGMKAGLTVHGFRSSFRDWAGEATSFPRELAEAALAHSIGDKTEAAYRRGDALEKRRKLMQAWDRYCTAPPTGNNVTNIRGRPVAA